MRGAADSAGHSARKAGRAGSPRCHSDMDSAPCSQGPGVPPGVSAELWGVRPRLSPDGGGLPDIAGSWTHHPKISACPLRPSL